MLCSWPQGGDVSQVLTLPPIGTLELWQPGSSGSKKNIWLAHFECDEWFIRPPSIIWKYLLFTNAFCQLFNRRLHLKTLHLACQLGCRLALRNYGVKRPPRVTNCKLHLCFPLSWDPCVAVKLAQSSNNYFDPLLLFERPDLVSGFSHSLKRRCCCCTLFSVSIFLRLCSETSIKAPQVKRCALMLAQHPGCPALVNKEECPRCPQRGVYAVSCQ